MNYKIYKINKNKKYDLIKTTNSYYDSILFLREENEFMLENVKENIYEFTSKSVNEEFKFPELTISFYIETPKGD